MPSPTTRKLTEDNSRFAVSSPMLFAVEDVPSEGEDAQRKRTFSGVAYSGGVIADHWYWGNVVFDMSTMAVPPKLPALIDHNRSMRAGYVTNSDIDNTRGFTVNGVLLSNENGSAVAKDSDEGFPWQMSVHIEPASIEEFAPGEAAVVNGRNLVGPLTVFRNSTIVEVSFTATGHDPNTAAVAMSRGGVQQPSSTGEPTMTPEQIADLQKANAELKAASEKAIADLAKFSKERRTADIKTLFSDIGREYKEDDADVLAFADMPQASFDAMGKMMRSQFKKPEVPGNLFSHTATSGNNPNQNSSTQVTEDALVKDAKRRAEQFSKRMAF